MLPPPPVAIFPPAAAMLPRGPPQFATPYPPPIFYWPYPSPPVSPTNYYTPANGIGGIAPIPQQAALVSQIYSLFFYWDISQFFCSYLFCDGTNVVFIQLKLNSGMRIIIKEALKYKRNFK